MIIRKFIAYNLVPVEYAQMDYGHTLPSKHTVKTVSTDIPQDTGNVCEEIRKRVLGTIGDGFLVRLQPPGTEGGGDRKRATWKAMGKQVLGAAQFHSNLSIKVKELVLEEFERTTLSKATQKERKHKDKVTTHTHLVLTRYGRSQDCRHGGMCPPSPKPSPNFRGIRPWLPATV